MTNDEARKLLQRTLKQINDAGIEVAMTTEADDNHVYKTHIGFVSTGTIFGDPAVILCDDGRADSNDDVTWEDM